MNHVVVDHLDDTKDVHLVDTLVDLVVHLIDEDMHEDLVTLLEESTLREMLLLQEVKVDIKDVHLVDMLVDLAMLLEENMLQEMLLPLQEVKVDIKDAHLVGMLVDLAMLLEESTLQEKVDMQTEEGHHHQVNLMLNQKVDVIEIQHMVRELLEKEVHTVDLVQ
ncbi:hypothetical protein KA478_02045 [Patescibacteria group bacterium]|nr:hypothetical protein [Patescibacteria group bacterium]